MPSVTTVTVREAAEITGLTEKAIRRRIERGQLNSVNRNGQRLVVRQSLVETGLVKKPADEPATLDPSKSGLKPISAAADAAALLAALPEYGRAMSELGRYKALTESSESEAQRLRDKVSEIETKLEAARQREVEMNKEAADRESDLLRQLEAARQEANRGGFFRRRRGSSE